MYKHTISGLRAVIVTTAVALATIFPAAYAQRAELVSTINIPFAFTYDAAQLPAGRYSFSLVADQSLRFQSASVTVAEVILPGSEQAEVGAPRLVFHRYGDKYFLANMITVDGKRRFVLESKEERGLRRMERNARSHKLAIVQPAKVDVTVAEAR